VTLDTQPSRESRIRIAHQPVDYRVKVAASVAEGDPLQVEVQGLRIEQVDDRCSVLSEVNLTQEHQLHARCDRGYWPIPVLRPAGSTRVLPPYVFPEMQRSGEAYLLVAVTWPSCRRTKLLLQVS